MPNKTIYVSDNDLPLFERAQELSKTNLSSVIVHALRRFVELEEARQRGFGEITVIVNGKGAHEHKRFLGQRLVRWLQSTANGKGTEILNVYRTAGKRYALHTRSIPNWEVSWGDPEFVGNPKNWGVGNGIVQKVLSWGFDWETFMISGDYSLKVFENLEDLRTNVSIELFGAVSQAMEEPEIEDLDI